MLGTIREFWNDQRGIAMIFVAIMLPVLIGFALLAVDISRANGLHNDLQKAVDALALAAAAELDGKLTAAGLPVVIAARPIPDRSLGDFATIDPRTTAGKFSDARSIGDEPTRQ